MIHIVCLYAYIKICMGWLWLVGSIKLQVSFAKEPYKRDIILQKRPILLSILLTVATPYHIAYKMMQYDTYCMYTYNMIHIEQ